MEYIAAQGAANDVTSLTIAQAFDLIRRKKLLP
jgi:hypothetical protein